MPSCINFTFRIVLAEPFACVVARCGLALIQQLAELRTTVLEFDQ